MIKHHLRRLALPLVTWTVLWAAFFGAFLVGQQQLSAGDLSGQFHAFGQFQARELAAGRLPTWSPGSYGGFPFAADPQSAVFYPLRWLTLLLSPSGELPFAFLQLEVLLHVWLAGVLVCGLVYALTRRAKAGLVSAVAFGLGGYLTGYPLLQLAILETITWLPAVLLAIHLCVSSERVLAWGGCAGAALAMAILAGHPQSAMHVAYLSAVYFLFRSIRRRWRWDRVCACGGLIASVALGLSAVAWIPALRYTLATTRSQVDYAFVSTGLPLEDWVQLWVPNTLSLWAPQYGGVLVVALGLLAWWSKGDRPANRAEIRFWGLTSLIAGWLALGDPGVLYRVAYLLVPGMSVFRQQERFLGLCALGMSVLAGLGMAAWLDSDVSRWHRMRWRLPRFLAAGLGLAFALLLAWLGWDGGWILAWLRQLLLAGAVLSLLWSGRHRRLVAIVLAVVLAADLYLVGRETILHSPAMDSDIWEPPLWIEELQSDTGLWRIDQGYFVHANFGEIYGLETVSGISPLVPELLDDLRQLPRERFWQLMGVRYVISTEPLAMPHVTMRQHIPDGTIENQLAEAWIYRYALPMPRAFMVHESEVHTSREALLTRLRSPDWDPAKSVLLLGYQLSLGQAQEASMAVSHVQVVRSDPRSLDIRIETDAAGYLVVGEWYVPGWRAMLNGQTVPTLRANHAFHGIHLPPGNHHVTFRFRPNDLLAGAIISGLSLLGLLALAWKGSIYQLRQEQRIRSAAVRLPGALRHEHLPTISVRSQRLLVAGSALFALALRFYALNRSELGIPEAAIVLRALRTGPLFQSASEGLYPWILRHYAAVAGVTEIGVRVPAVLAGVVLVVVAWTLGRRVGNAWMGIGLALSAGLSQLSVAYGQTVQGGHALGLSLMLLATVVLMHNSVHKWLATAAYVGLAVLALAIWPLTGLLLGGHLIYLLGRDPRQGSRQIRVPAVLAIVALGVLAGWWLLSAPEGLTPRRLDPTSASALLRHVVDGFGRVTVGLYHENGVTQIAGMTAVLFTGWSGLDLIQRRSGVGWLLYGGLVAGIGGLFLMCLWSPAYDPLDWLLVAPVIWSLLLVGLSRLWSSSLGARQLLAVVLTVGILGLNAWSLVRHYRRAGMVGAPGYRAISAVLMQEAGPDDLLIATIDDPRWGYYLRQADLPRTIIASHLALDQAELGSKLGRFTQEHERLWHLVAHEPCEADQMIDAWLEANTVLHRIARSPARTLTAHLPINSITGLISDQERITWVEGTDSVIALCGTSLLVDGRPVVDASASPILGPGSVVDQLLLWCPSGPTSRGLTVFVHLVDGHGRLVAQHDGVPVGGTSPTTSWDSGQVIVDRHRFVVPDSVGSFSGYVQVGFYESESVERVATHNGDDAVVLYTVAFSSE